MIFLATPYEMLKIIANNVKAKRLALNLSQQTLATKAGVSYSVLKKFEQSGRISLESLLKIAFNLDCLEQFKDLFSFEPHEHYKSLDEMMKEDKKRKRGRK